MKKEASWPELYLPHLWGKEGKDITIFFRDTGLSDLIGFSYQHLAAQEAVKDFTNHLRAIKEALPDGKTLSGKHSVRWGKCVGILLDNGLPFNTSLYQALSESEEFITITPREYLESFSFLPPLSRIVPGSWIYGNLTPGSDIRKKLGLGRIAK
jgi:alpha-amylase/alpha-mannosidase (GH57 family)